MPVSGALHVQPGAEIEEPTIVPPPVSVSLNETGDPLDEGPAFATVAVTWSRPPVATGFGAPFSETLRSAVGVTVRLTELAG